MQTFIKRCMTIFALTITAMTALPQTAVAERVVVQENNGHNAKTKTVKQNDKVKVEKQNHKAKASKQSRKAKVVKHNAKKVTKRHHQHDIGHHFSKKEVVVINNWRTRGLPQPRRDEVYIAHGDSIYLAAAATLLVKALID
ncbi:hypothetical protein DSM110093_02995 [Sulfitobacter sp. DSM 110093]|uniref:hypothetical protein n=1 Tax=Sulfitobacter sp. DSM 110093 TaxID=2883127 RepID=UPI001FAC1F6E|nr:hypothetical protein [Sulfitobacter sp. DSM 110093]UOA33179.1 hypothetical protein DSM110093_02995 [Sulfitobacter sp. DSM 110093]